MMAVASGVWAEAVSLETAWNLQEVSPSEDGERKNMKQELERIGYLGDMKASYKANPFAAHFEVHIEQGPILEKEKRKIGVVKGMYSRFPQLHKLTILFRCTSIQMVRSHRQRSRYSRWYYANVCSYGCHALCREIDRCFQLYRKEIRRLDHNWYRKWIAWLNQYHGSYCHIFSRYPTC